MLIMDAINKCGKVIILGLCGSATVDGGAGMAQALGVRFLDKKGNEIKELGAGGMLNKIASIDVSVVSPKIKRAIEQYGPRGGLRSTLPGRGLGPGTGLH